MLRLASFTFATTLLALAACGRPHDLGIDTTSSGSGAGGATTSSTTATSSTTSTTSTGTGGAEPTGPTELTVVNGLNDYDAVRFCFLPGDTPWPSSASGLPFARAKALDFANDLPADADVTPWIIAGNLAATAGLTCSQIIAMAQQPPDAGAPVLASALGVIPKEVLASGRSMLLAPTGCMGGPGHDDPSAMYVCGTGYSSTTPTLGVTLLAMSRKTTPTHVSLQIVNAATMPKSDVGVLPSYMGAMPVVVAPSLSQGSIGPTPPFMGLAVDDLGALPNAQIETFYPGSSSMTSQTALGDVLTASDVGMAGFKNGAGIVLVAVGSQPGFSAGAFWHKLTFAAIAADPG